MSQGHDDIYKYNLTLLQSQTLSIYLTLTNSHPLEGKPTLRQLQKQNEANPCKKISGIPGGIGGIPTLRPHAWSITPM